MTKLSRFVPEPLTQERLMELKEEARRARHNVWGGLPVSWVEVLSMIAEIEQNRKDKEPA